mmetsp:Transcript_10453/g.22059  ORF Transcript_10453/g.22059 Transcript_10453/m.22059 type:complete len:99 (+) Transcript_10453:268-564(+)
MLRTAKSAPDLSTRIELIQHLRSEFRAQTNIKDPISIRYLLAEGQSYASHAIPPLYPLPLSLAPRFAPLAFDFNHAKIQHLQHKLILTSRSCSFLCAC